VHWHIADDVLDWPNVRYVSKFSAPTYLDERPESARDRSLTPIGSVVIHDLTDRAARMLLPDGAVRCGAVAPRRIIFHTVGRIGDHQVRVCVQRRLACSAGDKPAGVEVRAP
jgi:hypothetical protein